MQEQYRNQLSAEERAAIAETSKALGVEVRITQSLKGGEADGYYKDGTVYLAMDADDKLMNVFAHEITHHFEETAPESYAEYKQAVLEALVRHNADTLRGENLTIESLIQNKQEKYIRSGVNLNVQEAENELVADYTHNILNNPERFREFANRAEHQGFLSKLMEAIREIFAKVKGKFYILTEEYGTPYDAQFAKTEQELQRVFDEAYRNKNTQSTSDGRYSFAGERALIADYTTLETAKTMQERGISNEEIFKNTGWFKGADNQWRFEINDKDLRVIETNPDFQKVQAASEQLQNAESEQERTAALNELRRAAQETQARGTFLKLPDVIQADALFETYPFLRDIDVFYDFDSGSRASYYPGYNAISIDVMKNPTAQGQRRSFAHEIQHAIQEHEGFAIGANAELWNGDQKRYRNTAGELEAEDVKNRLDMTDEERSNTFPESAKENPERVFMDRDKVYGERMNEDDYTKSFSKTKITPDDVKAVQSIPRKSVNAFTSEDIKKTENFAKKYYSEMGEKSPFFRAWFGDWRANDTTPVKVANESGSARGITKNIDTGWDIQISGKVFNETKAHTYKKNVTAKPFLNYINSIVESAVLLDSYTVPNDRVKSSNSAMMHSLYAIADMGNGRELVKLYVEELNDVNSDGTIKRAYQLQNITKQQLNAKGSEKNILAQSTAADTYTVSQLFDLVKGLDKNFKPNEASKVVNEDGTPKVVYHGTRASFNTFILKPEVEFGRALGDGFYFTENYKRAFRYANGITGKDHGGHIMSVYLDIKKPFYITEQNKMNYGDELNEGLSDGKYEGVIDTRNGTYLVFSSNQIKSATDNIGTFDNGNDDIRYSLKESKMNEDADEENSNIYDYTKSFSEQLDDWQNGKIPRYDTLMIGGTPRVFQKIGFNALPFTINQKHVNYALNGTKDSDHALGMDLLKQLPKALETPVAIFESQTQPNRVVAIVDMKHNGKSVVMPIEVDGYGTQNDVSIDSNAVVSVYAKDNAITKQLNEAIQKENSGKMTVFYLNKIKAAALLQTAGLQLPGHLFRNNGYIHSIRENGSNVNPKFENVTHSQQFKRWFGDWENNPNTASKVVNEDGTPKIVYHGTDGEFTVFENMKTGKNFGDISSGMFFFTNYKEGYPNSAVDYARNSSKNNGGNPNIKEVYLDIKKPLRLDSRGYYSTNEYYDKNAEDIYMRFLDGDYDGVIIENSDKNADDSILYAVDNSKQIKSATDNIGTFDKGNDDTRYSLKENNISVNTEDITADFKNLNKTRKEFVEFARKNFPKSVINRNTQKEIGISRTGLDKFLSGNITKEKYATGFKIPQIIESTVKVGEAENKKGKQGINGYEY